MVEALEYALQRPKAWHSIGKSPADVEAVKRLAPEGLIEIAEYRNQYRVTP